MVIALGSISPGALAAILMGNPAMEAADVILTVQVDEAPRAMLVGPQVNVLSDWPCAAELKAARDSARFVRQTAGRDFFIEPPVITNSPAIEVARI